MYKSIFERYEKKYMLDSNQYSDMLNLLSYTTQSDRYSESRIFSLYYDTPDYLLIRRSLEKPVYKEKLRLRCYTEPYDSTPCFIELKKKYSGVVCKRRICTDYKDGFEYLNGGARTAVSGQIAAEAGYFLKFYRGIRPSMACFYNRRAVRGREDEDLRITFDRDIAYRFYDLDLRSGAHGERLLDGDRYLMEIKTNGVMPVWLCRMLDELRLYPTSFSKYGSAYIRELSSQIQPNGGALCV